MKITIQSIKFKASVRLKELVNEKIEKLFKKNEKIIHADVTLYEGAKGNPQNQFCEIRLSVKGNDHFVKKHAEKYEQALSLAVEALRKIMRRKKIQKISARNRKNLYNQ